ncbi:MAG TPA: DUF2142 domain-containing protein, partial [Solirubrobacteraceae bacterium]
MGLLRQIPRSAWICAIVAFLNVVSWSIFVPAFQGPDEQAHFAYVQQLVEAHALPSSSSEQFSPEETVALVDLQFQELILNPAMRFISSAPQQRRLERDEALHLSRRGSGGAGVAYSQPPLFYLLQTIPYTLGAHATILSRLELMRLLSALLAAVTVVFVYLFLCEALPGAPWAWTVGALCAALAPLFGFASSAVNPDVLLFAVAAVIFYSLARAFRRGLTHQTAILIGALLAVGFMSKLNFVGMVPGILLGLAVLTRRHASTSGRSAYRSLLVALGIAFTPGLLYTGINLLSGRPAFGLLSSAIKSTTRHGSLLAELSYVWQFYLPRLP